MARNRLDEERFALYFTVHHSLFDGIGASRRFLQMLSTDPEERDLRPVWTIGPNRPNRADRPRPSSNPLHAIRRSAGGAIQLGGATAMTLKITSSVRVPLDFRNL